VNRLRRSSPSAAIAVVLVFGLISVVFYVSPDSYLRTNVIGATFRVIGTISLVACIAIVLVKGWADRHFVQFDDSGFAARWYVRTSRYGWSEVRRVIVDDEGRGTVTILLWFGDGERRELPVIVRSESSRATFDEFVDLLRAGSAAEGSHE